MRCKNEKGPIREIPSHNKKLVLILGAGATYSDRANLKNIENRPPLDRDFFKGLYPNRFDDTRYFRVAGYFDEIYGINIVESENDSIEKTMATVYSDIFNKKLQKKAFKAFQDLLSLFTARLAETTNIVRITKRIFLYQILDYYFENGFTPDNITIISYNYDIQIEKTLEMLKKSQKWKMNDDICNFPSCYQIKITKNQILRTESNVQLFKTTFRNNGIKILKLHGSVNWYSKHKTERPSLIAMFSPEREINISCMLNVSELTNIYTSPRRFRDFLGLPIIVPPIFLKSSIFHNKIKNIWLLAEKALTDSDEVLFFGYSCPVSDVESSNMLKRAFRKNNKNPKISIIDPSSETMKRYLDLLSLRRICYYQNAQEFLDTVNEVV